ncbi:MAG: hypothetical protein HKL89_02315 [Candidatus Dormibacteraeota bacterium]|nr:hypothetical protein [Candidatus Dormibacteraeota bacterium]
MTLSGADNCGQRVWGQRGQHLPAGSPGGTLARSFGVPGAVARPDAATGAASGKRRLVAVCTGALGEEPW